MTAVDAALGAWAPEAALELGVAESLVAPVSGRVGQLARLRIAWLLGGPAALEHRRPEAIASGIDGATIDALSTWTASPLFDEADRACLALAEQFVIDVSAVTDADVEAVLDHLGPAGLYGFVQCLWGGEMTERLRLGLGAVLAGEPADEQGVRQ